MNDIEEVFFKKIVRIILNFNIYAHRLTILSTEFTVVYVDMNSIALLRGQLNAWIPVSTTSLTALNISIAKLPNLKYEFYVYVSWSVKYKLISFYFW